MFTFGATAAVGRPECSAPAEAPVSRASTISTSGESVDGVGEVRGLERCRPEEEELANLADLGQPSKVQSFSTGDNRQSLAQDL